MIYFIRGGDFIKIGKAKNPKKRLKALQTGAAQKLSLLATFDGNKDAPYHRRFKHIHKRGEWFLCTTELLDFIERGNPITTIWSFSQKGYSFSIQLKYKMRVIVKRNGTNLYIGFDSNDVQQDFSALKNKLDYDITYVTMNVIDEAEVPKEFYSLHENPVMDVFLRPRELDLLLYGQYTWHEGCTVAPVNTSDLWRHIEFLLGEITTARNHFSAAAYKLLNDERLALRAIRDRLEWLDSEHSYNIGNSPLSRFTAWQCHREWVYDMRLCEARVDKILSGDKK